MSCEDVRDDLVAYADQAVDAHTRERIAAHLVGCAACRHELADVQRVRRLLGTCGAPREQLPPAELTSRLVAIAGPDAGRELWLATGDSTALPSPRRRRRNRLLFGLTATSAGLVGTFGAMVMMAPALPAVSDPDAAPRGGVPTALAMQAAVTSSTEASASGTAEVDCSGDFDCPATLVGLERSTVSNQDEERVEVVYHGSARTVVVVEQRGVLAGRPDSRLHARVWQSGSVVYCVMSQSQALVAQASAELPHDGPATGSPLRRFVAGWHELVGGRG